MQTRTWYLKSIIFVKRHDIDHIGYLDTCGDGILATVTSAGEDIKKPLLGGDVATVGFVAADDVLFGGGSFSAASGCFGFAISGPGGSSLSSL